MKTPREYQVKAVGMIKKEWETVNSTLCVVPTGGGKTFIAAQLVKDMLPKRTMFVAHRKELIFQARNAIDEIISANNDLFHGVSCDIEMAELYASHRQFNSSPVIAMVQSLNSKVGFGKRMDRFNPMDFGLLVIDECHHGIADSYKSVIAFFKRNPELKILGLTATPDRLDEEALGQICDSVAFEYEILDAIHDGWLVPIDQVMVPIRGLDFSHVKTVAGDLNQSDLAAIMESESIIQGVVQPTLELMFGVAPHALDQIAIAEWGKFLESAGGDPRRTLVFTVSVAQAQMLSNIFNRVSEGLSDWVCGTTPQNERDDKLARYSAGQIHIMVNCNCLSEGFDSPGVEIIVQARPTKSRSLYAQQVGRSTRPLPGLVDGLAGAEQRKEAIAGSKKPCALIVDFCIAEGQRVLTDAGLIPIESVTLEMKVWDGVDFVEHCGTVFRGERNTIEYAGLKATNDHRVWTEEGWKTFGQCAREQAPIAVTGFSDEEVRETDGCYRRHNSHGAAEEFGLCPDAVRLRRSRFERIHKFDFWKSWLSEMWLPGQFSEVALRAMLKCAAALSESVERSIQILRWAWNKVCVPQCVGHGFLDSGQLGTSSPFELGQNRPGWKLRAGKHPLCRQADADLQSEAQEATTVFDVARFQAATPGYKVFGFHASQDVERYERSGNREEVLRVFTETKRRTWDILNCGPRHRFTVEGLLVANCGNSGKHKLMSTVDILAGNVCDAVLDRVKLRLEKSEAPGRVAELLDEEDAKLRAEQLEAKRKAELAANAQRKKIVARTSYTLRQVNPFDILDITPMKMRGWDQSKKLSDKQTSLLLKQGINPDGLTYVEGRQIIAELFSRWDHKQCSFKQSALLKRHGLPSKVSRDQAKTWIDSIANNHWQRPPDLVVNTTEENSPF